MLTIEKDKHHFQQEFEKNNTNTDSFLVFSKYLKYKVVNYKSNKTKFLFSFN